MQSTGLSSDPWTDIPAWPQTCHVTPGPVWWLPGWVGPWLLPQDWIYISGLALSPNDAKSPELSADPLASSRFWKWCHRALAGKSLPCCCVLPTWWTNYLWLRAVDPSHIVLSIPQSQKFTEGSSAAQSTTSFSGEGTKEREAEEPAGVHSRGSQLTQVQSPEYWDVLQLVDLMKSQIKEDGYIKIGDGDMGGKTKGSSSQTFFTLTVHKSGLGLFCDFCLIISQKCKGNSPPTTAPACTV